MYYVPNMYQYQYPYYANIPMYNYDRQSGYWTIPDEVEHANRFGSFRSSNDDDSILLKDYGAEPFVVNINEATKQNNTFRTALWTGNHLQVTLMSLNVGEDIGLEMHPNVDQFLRIEQGRVLFKWARVKII